MLVATAAAALVLSSFALAQAPKPARTRLNSVIALLEQKQPVFGLYAPSAGGQRGRGGPGRATVTPGTPGAPPIATPPILPPAETPTKTPADLAKDALAYESADFLFSGSMEGGVDRGLPAFTDLAKALIEAGGHAPNFGLKHAFVVKTPEIAPDPAKAIDNISRQLNVGASGIMFVKVESAEEVKQGLAAMRFKSKGGTRPDGVDTAPEFWGMSEKDYRAKADLWPLNPEGELINWTIVESKEGLAHVREIAAVKGIGVLWPGAGTLRGVFSTTDASGQRQTDTAAWENAIQQVLAACKEFNVPCGFPATPNDIEMRMKQGFSVFVMNWGEQGFKAIEIGRKAAGRPMTGTGAR
jgi:4-hydroxy-2-oxoheptanedioate aldolase